MKITTKYDVTQPVTVPDPNYPDQRVETRIIGITHEVSLKKTKDVEETTEVTKYQVEHFPFKSYAEGAIESLSKKSKEAAQGEQ